MQLSFKLEASEPFSLPLQYNHLVQGFIYEAIDPELSTFLHGEGYIVDGRPFRMFVFSRLLGNFRIDSKAQIITFGPQVTLWIASPLENFCLSMIRNIVRRRDLHLGNHVLRGLTFSSLTPNVSSGSIVVFTRSPITVYSTLLRPDGRKYTVYFQPGDPDYDRLITENLLRKYSALNHRAPPEGQVSVRALSRIKRNIVIYKGFIIKGYSGKLRLEGPPELLQMALDAGLGAKSSQGFGFVQMR